MWENPLAELLPYMSNYVVTTGANLLIHSTIILSAGLLGAYALKQKGAAAQSIVLRVFLAAFLLCTPVSIILHEVGIGGLTITVPLTAPHNQTDYEISLRPETKNVGTSNELEKILPDRQAKTGIEHKTLQSDKTAFPLMEKYDRPPARSYHTKTTTTPDRKEYTPARPEIKQTEIQTENKLAVLYLLMTIVWTVLTFIVLARLVLNNLYLAYVRITAVQAKKSFLDASKYAALELTMKAPLVLQSPSVASPFAAGILKQYIILPLGKHETGLPEKEVFLHELAHLKRRDPFWNLLVRITRIIIPFQPLIWIYSRWMAVTNDYVCDDYVMNSIENHRSYASNLAHLARHYHPRGYEVEVGAGFISVKSSLRRRIVRILDATRKLSLRVSARLVFTISLLCAFITFVTGFIGIKGKNNIQNSYASEKKTDEGSEEIPSITHDTELPELETVVSSGRYDRPTVNDTLLEINEQPHNNAREPDTAEHDDSDLAPESTETNNAAVIQHPQAVDSDEIADSPSVNTDTAPESKNSAGNETIETTETITEEPVAEIDTGELEKTNTVVVQEPDVAETNSFALYDRFETTNSLAPTVLGENGSQTPAPVPVEISYNYRDANRNNPEERMWSNLYQAADRNQKCPIWSPDGSHIAYSDPSYGIWMVPIGGGEPILVHNNYQNIRSLKFNFMQAGLETLSFSPDGKELAFTIEVFDRKTGVDFDLLYDSLLNDTSYPESDTFHIIVSVNIETGEKRIIAEDTRSGSWGRNGRYFAYVKYSRPELHVIDFNTGEDQILLNDAAISPCFSSDSRHIIFSRKAGGSIELFRIPIEGGNPEQLTFHDKGNDVETRLVDDSSPDGEWVLFTGIQAEKSFLGAYNALSGSVHEIFPDETVSHSSGKFSSDGTKICFYITSTDRFGTFEKLYIGNFILPSEAAEKSAQVTDATPESFALTGNFPNPFNASTTIRFSLHSTGFARLTVYNMIGQKVRELIAGQMTEGTHTIVWNGKDNYGNKVSTGTYISHLQLGNLTATRRMMLIK